MAKIKTVLLLLLLLSVCLTAEPVRLPRPRGDTRIWGALINQFLRVSHNEDGTLKASAISGSETDPCFGISAIGALSGVADNEFIVGTGPNTYAHESGATARTSIGLGADDVVEHAGVKVGFDEYISFGSGDRKIWAHTNDFYVRNTVHGGKLFLQAESDIGVVRGMTFDPDIPQLQLSFGMDLRLNTGEITDGTTALTVADINTAYDHSQDNTQAHSDYLLNSENDESSGTITAAGFTTAGDVDCASYVAASAINIEPNNDSDDYLEFTSDGNAPIITVIGGSTCKLKADSTWPRLNIEHDADNYLALCWGSTVSYVKATADLSIKAEGDDIAFESDDENLWMKLNANTVTYSTSTGVTAVNFSGLNLACEGTLTCDGIIMDDNHTIGWGGDESITFDGTDFQITDSLDFGTYILTDTMVGYIDQDVTTTGTPDFLYVGLGGQGAGDRACIWMNYTAVQRVSYALYGGITSPYAAIGSPELYGISFSAVAEPTGAETFAYTVGSKIIAAVSSAASAGAVVGTDVRAYSGIATCTGGGGGCTIPNAYGYYAETFTEAAGGIIDEACSFYDEGQTAAGINYGLGINTADNYINGSLRIGSAAAPLSKLHLDLATEDYEIVDAGSADATEQDWIGVEIGGVTGYIRVFAAK